MNSLGISFFSFYGTSDIGVKLYSRQFMDMPAAAPLRNPSNTHVLSLGLLSFSFKQVHSSPLNQDSFRRVTFLQGASPTW